LVNRPVAANSKEWKSTEGQDAIQIERGKHERRGTWDSTRVKELGQLLRETREGGKEVVIGGVHPVMYRKHAEDAVKAILRARVVYTAPSARTSSGLDAHTLYQEISSAPVTFQNLRARAVGALKGFRTSTRDADSAYLQARLDERPTTAETWVALPRAFWPAGWGEKYSRPMVPLVLALFGHPEAGSIWEEHSVKKLLLCNFQSNKEFKSVFRHPETSSIMTAYVDDFELEATDENAKRLWKELEKHIDFKDPPEYWGGQGVQHLGCRHKVKHLKQEGGHVETRHISDMTKYIEDLCARFEEKFSINLKASSTPFLDATAVKRLMADS
jgi:hypothetical protein